jgi:hypothetical protein
MALSPGPGRPVLGIAFGAVRVEALEEPFFHAWRKARAFVAYGHAVIPARFSRSTRTSEPGGEKDTALSTGLTMSCTRRSAFMRTSAGPSAPEAKLTSYRGIVLVRVAAQYAGYEGGKVYRIRARLPCGCLCRLSRAAPPSRRSMRSSSSRMPSRRPSSLERVSLWPARPPRVWPPGGS